MVGRNPNRRASLPLPLAFPAWESGFSSMGERLANDSACALLHLLFHCYRPFQASISKSRKLRVSSIRFGLRLQGSRNLCIRSRTCFPEMDGIPLLLLSDSSKRAAASIFSCASKQPAAAVFSHGSVLLPRLGVSPTARCASHGSVLLPAGRCSGVSQRAAAVQHHGRRTRC